MFLRNSLPAVRIFRMSSPAGSNDWTAAAGEEDSAGDGERMRNREVDALEEAFEVKVEELKQAKEALEVKDEELKQSKASVSAAAQNLVCVITQGEHMLAWEAVS